MKRFLIGICIVFTILLSSLAGAQEGGVGVVNTPPTFVSIDINETDDLYYINVNVSDYNGRGDIYRVFVNIYDTDDEMISNISYQQWDSTDRATASRIDAFMEHRGDYLVSGEVIRYVGNDWFLENTTLELQFVLRPLDGKTINIRASDFNMEEAFYEGPITSKTLVQPIIEGRAIPLVISMMTAGLGTAAVVYDRRNKNVLAQTVRKKMEEEIG